MKRLLSSLAQRQLKPRSCDTFVALPPATANGCVIFGKNSDRPCEEVQEVIHQPAEDHAPGSKVECTYIEVDQVAHTHAVILSKPAWMWGAEMGANEHGVCIGNEAVWTKMQGDHDLEERLLGMDLLRLGLERATAAREALHVITQLLEDLGQGGPCFDSSPTCSSAYHNSFIICDRTEAWVLETAGKHWAAQRITSGVRNISNQLTIRTDIDLMSSGLKEHAQAQKWWTPEQGDFDFAKAYSTDFEETRLKPTDENPCSRQLWGTKLLNDFSAGGKFAVDDMFKILRDERSGICMSGGFASTGSQVSVLPPVGSGAPCVHWFTATANPHRSLFKPFLFCAESSAGDKTKSPDFGDGDPAKVKPRFQTSVDRRHRLWRAHEKLEALLEAGDPKGKVIVDQMMHMETMCLQDMDDLARSGDFNADTAPQRVAHIFKHMVDLEMNFY